MIKKYNYYKYYWIDKKVNIYDWITLQKLFSLSSSNGKDWPEIDKVKNREKELKSDLVGG